MFSGIRNAESGSELCVLLAMSILYISLCGESGLVEKSVLFWLGGK